MSKEIKLTEKQKRFCEFYIELGNASEAARRAGYSQKYTNTNVSKLLQNTSVKSYIDNILAKMQDERIADATEIMQQLTSIMRNEQTEEVVVVEGIGQGESTARNISKDIPIKDRIKAAELLGKRYGLFTEKIEITETPQIIDDVPDGDADD